MTGVRQLRFGPFTLNLDTRQLERGRRAIHLAPKAFELLAILIDERPKVLSKAVLQHRLWPDSFVAEANLSNLVAEIRAALEDSSRRPAYIRTAFGFGYAFCGEATTVADTAGAPHATADAPPCWLERGDERFDLPVGEHVIGRDPDVDVRLDAPTVSRHHAKIVVTEVSTTLEDSGSKNGTFREDERITSPVPLADGETIRFGSLRVRFHAPRRSAVTETIALPGG